MGIDIALKDVLGQRKYPVGCYNDGCVPLLICLTAEDLQTHQTPRVNPNANHNLQHR